MSKAPAFQLYVKDLLVDTRHLSLAAKGAWMDCLCFMWLAPTRGEITDTVVGWARRFGATVDQADAVIDELLSAVNADPVADGARLPDGRVTLRNRRMFRDAKDAQGNAVRQDRYRQRHTGRPSNGVSNGGCNAEVTTPSPTPSPISLPPPGGVGGAAGVAEELQRVGVRSPKRIAECCAVPGITPIGVALLAEEVAKGKDVEDVGAIVGKRIVDGARLPVPTPETLCRLAKGGRLLSVCGRVVNGKPVKHGPGKLYVGDEVIPAADLKPENIQLTRRHS